MERWSPPPTWSPHLQSSKEFQKLLMGVEQDALPPREAAKTGLGVTWHGFFFFKKEVLKAIALKPSLQLRGCI